MQEIDSQEVCDKLKTGELNYINFYNNLEPQQYFSIEHYLKNDHDTIDNDQNLNILFQDIEVYGYHSGEFDPKNAAHPISSNTIYSSFEKIYHVYFLILRDVLPDITKEEIVRNEDQIRKELLENGYIKEDESIKIYVFENESDLIKSFWSKIHEIDPNVLSGYFFDGFDLPYIYNRLLKLYGDEKTVNQIVSKFGVVKSRGMQGRTMYQISEYPVLDIQHLYKPRDEGGLNYGEKEPSYTLDWLSEKHLNLKKLEYKDEGISLDAFYEQDPVNYIKYNIIDVVLTVRLNEKLRHIELHNMIRRDMKTPLTMSLRGPSALFDTLFSYEIENKGQKVRYGVVEERTLSIGTNETSNIPLPKQNKIKKWTINNVDNESYSKMLNRYPGAYVKDSKGRIVNEKDGILIDLDASSLYP